MQEDRGYSFGVAVRKVTHGFEPVVSATSNEPSPLVVPGNRVVRAKKKRASIVDSTDHSAEVSARGKVKA